MRYFAAVPEAELTDEELARRATALYQIGDVRMRQGDLEGAQQPLEESLALARQLAARDPGSAERLFGLGQSEFWAGYARWRRGDVDGARRHFEAYHDASQRLVERDPANLDWRRELSYAESNLGSVLQQQGDLPGALERFGAALALDLALVADSPTPEEADRQRFELAATHNTMGVALERMGRLEEARVHYEADLALRRRLVAGDRENQRWREFLGTSHEYLGNLLVTRGELAAARPHLEGARAVFDDLAERDAANGDWRYKQAWSYLWLGRLEHAEGAFEAARDDWRRAGGIARDLTETDSERANWRQLLGVARYHAALGEAKTAPHSARVDLRQAIEILQPWSDENPDDRRADRWLTEALLLVGDLEAEADPAAASRAWRSAADVLNPLVDARDPALLALRARVLDRLGRKEEAAAVRAELLSTGAAAGGAIPGSPVPRGTG